jgi:branched-chain amino acid transport system permease protein
MWRQAAARARGKLRNWRGQAWSAPAGRGTFGPLLALALAGGIAGCGDLDPEQLRICERLIPAIEADGARIEIVRATADPAAADTVRIEYRTNGASGDPDGSWISCRFGGSGFERDRLLLTGVATSGEGALSEIRVFMLRRYWLDLYEGQATPDEAAAAERSWARGLLYFLQLGVNGITVGCLYGLLAIGYTLVYGIVGRINLAFGEIAMVGAYTTFIAVTALALLGVGPLPLALLLVLAVVAATGAM